MRIWGWAKSACFGLGTILALQASPAFAEGKIGVAAAVQNQVFGNAQPLSNGSSVFANERIRTGDASTAQLLFVDQTNLAVGPKSEVVLDRFVYNPNGKGNVVIQTGRGVFRFVSGSQDPASYQVRTPVATIGIRGTMFTVLNGAGFNAIVDFYGTLIVHILATGQDVVVNAGWTLLIYPNGQYELFQSVDTMQAWLQYIDPVLINEFQQLFTSLTLLNALGNSFTPPPKTYHKGN
jgi:ferric-dicitrate binding protein FerR (iron transport regulator)